MRFFILCYLLVKQLSIFFLWSFGALLRSYYDAFNGWTPFHWCLKSSHLQLYADMPMGFHCSTFYLYTPHMFLQLLFKHIRAPIIYSVYGLFASRWLSSHMLWSRSFVLFEIYNRELENYIQMIVSRCSWWPTSTITSNQRRRFQYLETISHRQSQRELIRGSHDNFQWNRTIEVFFCL